MSSTQIHLAAAIAAKDTDEALAQAAAVASAATLVEYRLDLMGNFELARLIEESPLPAIITCRARREGGRFAGSEKERLAILQEALSRGAPFIDVEADALPFFSLPAQRQSRIIGSHHDFEGMLQDWAAWGWRIRSLGADIVKLVGTAQQQDDILMPLAWLHTLSYPGIGLAMGKEGQISRVLAPRFGQAFLSFAAAAEGTAAGQLDVRAMVQRHHFLQLAQADPLLLVLATSPETLTWLPAYESEFQRLFSPPRRPLILPLFVSKLGVGLWLSLVLARVYGLIVQPEVEIEPHLRFYGWQPSGRAWRVDEFRALMVSYDIPSPQAWINDPA
ncbi:MAG: type I 3-dehydroquinate dehydratase [Chloroflexi bacterium]|nr:type I 3-dehydroquinate dehydratase [Chloroflexota bacterium]